jgi:hypothetical protein
VPTELKLARVTPIHKQGIKANPDNYRPISVLSVLSKILEKHVCKHLMAYFAEHGLLCKYQSAFRTNHSCKTILLKLTDDWLEAMDKGLFMGVVMIDLRKAFDLVDHALLLRKLEIYGLDLNTLKWFQSYLDGDLKRYALMECYQSRSLSNRVCLKEVSWALLYL